MALIYAGQAGRGFVGGEKSARHIVEAGTLP